ncbi:BTAD domain-containing putative transcriptional regulator [Nocardia sp. CDC153]|uniref:AfsR/SARP family transcriptional regulator n=1 Tax=Nocardia sp. CDC153 TaxID=3112167 RepID=UPI002DBE8C96|nr:BTAD domain-containing putative transcriptional regulator [Nocardia sp. CDC153]MEC3951556.1 BTAD domain-containing putative transcriptional regulator [Nocardia sp. CDC153]
MGDSTPTALRGDIAVALLGEIAVRRDGVLTAVPGARARLLVAALATHPGRSRSAQALIDEVWGEDPPRAPMNALHTQVSRLRSALPEGALEIGPAGYRLILAPDRVDLTLAQRLEGQARQAHTAGDHRACLDLLAAARGLWRGEPAADLPPGPVAEELATLAAARRRALDALELSAREAIGDLPAAIELAQRAVAADPFDEPAHGTLMRVLAAAGRTNEALDVFATLRTRLVDQLGTDPGPALVALNTAILRGGAEFGSGNGGSAPGGQVTPIDGHRRTAPGAAGAHHDSDSSGHPMGPGTAVQPRSPGRLAASARIGGSVRTAEARELVGETAIGLRAAPNPLLGREADLAALEAALRSSRVVTVLGPGGTGKTRIANELGARMAHETAVALVELASLRADAQNPADTRAEIEVAIATTLGVADVVWETNVLRQAQKRDIRLKMREALGIRPTLLILDNCEHLIEAVAEVVADLIGVSDQLTVLTTSRAPLEIMAETVYPLPPLTIDASGSPATDLFEARARAVRPSVRLDPRTVARLCRTLDGLPLAIELAAARVRTMSVEEIDSRLDHRFALLRSGDRSSPQRHRTLHAVIEWSWNLLDEPQRVALRRLCRFPAGFTLEAAEYLLTGPEIDDPALAVDGLVSQSMLTVLEGEDGGTRYRMLETVREFGEEQLAFAGEIDWVMARMSLWARDFAVATARRYHTDEQLLAVLGLGADMDNLVAVLRYALERRDVATVHTVFPILAGLWVVRGAHAELINWSPRIIAVPPTTYPTIAAETDLYIQGQLLLGLHLMFGGPDTRDVARVRTTIRRILASGAPVSPVARYLGELATRPSNTTQLARMLSAGVRSPDEQIRLAALLLRANLCENDGMVYRSIKDAETAMRLSGDQDVWGTAMTTQHLGSMYGQSARYDEAVGYYRKAVELLDELRAFDEAVEMRGLLASTLAGMGDPAAARAALAPALGVVGELPADAPVTKPNHRIASVAAALAEIELAEGDIDTGLRRFRQVLPLMDWPHNVAMPGPATLIYASAVIDAHVLHGPVDPVRRTAVELTDVVVRVMGGQYWDLPQIGSMSCAIGTYLLATGQHVERGLELIVLTPKVFGRQDYPSMQWRLHLDLHRAAVGEERVTAALNAVAGLGRRKAAERIMTHLKAIDGTL